MRITSTVKYFVCFLLGLAAVVLLILFFINYQPKITGIAGACLLVIFTGLLLYVSGVQLFGFLGERADNILAVYTDVSGKALHIFSGFSVSGGRFATTSMRSIQYYCVLTDTQKVFYKVLFSHHMKPLSGRSGYEGFPSFEEAVLQGGAYKSALANFAAKAGRPLQPLNAIAAGNNHDYVTKLGANTFSIITNKALVKTSMQLGCFDETGKLVWKKKL